MHLKSLNQAKQSVTQIAEQFQRQLAMQLLAALATL